MDMMTVNLDCEKSVCLMHVFFTMFVHLTEVFLCLSFPTGMCSWPGVSLEDRTPPQLPRTICTIAERVRERNEEYVYRCRRKNYERSMVGTNLESDFSLTTSSSVS